MNTGVYAIYKSSGAAQFSLMKPKFDEKGFITKDGGILLEAAPGNGDKNNPQWDWSKKMKFAIGLADIAILLDEVKDKQRLIHDNNGVIKALEFRPGVDAYAGTFTLLLSEGAKESRKEIRVPLSNGEYNLLIRLLLSTLPALLNWGTE